MSHLPENDNSGGKTWLKKNGLPNLPTVPLFDGSVPDDSAPQRLTNRTPHEPAARAYGRLPTRTILLTATNPLPLLSPLPSFVLLTCLIIA